MLSRELSSSGIVGGWASDDGMAGMGGAWVETLIGLNSLLRGLALGPTFLSSPVPYASSRPADEPEPDPRLRSLPLRSRLPSRPGEPPAPVVIF